MATYTSNLNLKKPDGSENVAIGDINSNMDTIDQAYGTLNNQIAAKVKAVRQSWGKTLTASSFGQGILLINYTAAYLVWIQGDTNIRIASLRASGGTKTAADSITFGDDDVSGTGYTITRNGTTLTIESASNNTMSMFYM